MVTLFTDTLGCLQTHLNGTRLWVGMKTMLVASGSCQNIDISVFNSFRNLENLCILTHLLEEVVEGEKQLRCVSCFTIFSDYEYVLI